MEGAFEAFTDNDGRAQARVMAGDIVGVHEILVEVAGSDELVLMVGLTNLAGDPEPLPVPVLGWPGWLLLALLLGLSAGTRSLLSLRGWSQGSQENVA
ncbi:MAG: hypothetical protein ACNA7J_06080 [Wenzhouxiangella sp.]